MIAKYLGSDLHNNKPAGEKIAGAINVSGLVDFREISHDKGKHMRLPNPPYEAINLLILKKDMQIFGNFNWIIEQEGRRLQGKKEEKEAGEEEGEAVPSKSASNAVKANQPIEVEQNHHHQNQEPNRNNNEGTEASGYHTKRTATHTISNGPRFTEETYRRVQGAWTNSVYTDCVAPLVGISGSHEMYARMSEMYRTALPKVTRPMLCLMARDDPIAIERTLKHSLHLCQQSDSIIAAVTKGGQSRPIKCVSVLFCSVAVRPAPCHQIIIHAV